MTGFDDGTIYIRAIAETEDGYTLTTDCELTKDTVAPDVTGLSVSPNETNSALVLSWTNPEDDFEYAEIYRWEPDSGGGWYFASADEKAVRGLPAAASETDVWDSPDGSTGYWRWLDQTSDNKTNTYVDEYVLPDTTYYYIVVAVDPNGNMSSNPPRASGKLGDQPIYLYFMDISTWYIDDVYICAAFFPKKVIVDGIDMTLDIVSIEFEWSADGVVWQPFSTDLINKDSGLSYDYRDGYWDRYIYVDMSEFPEGSYSLKATATDEAGNTLAVTRELIKDTVADDVTNLMASPNPENDAIVLTWDITDDFYYAEVYRLQYSTAYPDGWWSYLGTSYSNTYTDYNVYPYVEYAYKVVAYDRQYNESQNPPETVGRLYTPEDIVFDGWTYSNEGLITGSNAHDFSMTARFRSYKQIERIDYSYSANGGSEWHDLKPYIFTQNAVIFNKSTGEGYQTVRINISGPLGLPDGDLLVRAEAYDINGNICVSEYLPLFKDAAPPPNVTNLTAELTEEKDAITLSWENPAGDFRHVSIYRNSGLYRNNYEGNTFIDTDIQLGSVYKYDIYSYDIYGNRTEKPSTVTVVVDGGSPVLVEFLPGEGYITNGNTVTCRATFSDDTPIDYILYEYSLDGGAAWISVNPDSTLPEKGPDSKYYLSWTFDVSWATTNTMILRATAVDAKGRSATASITITVDHDPPPAPANFTATPGEGKITLSWDPVDGAQSYRLDWVYINPNTGNQSSYFWIIDAPAHSYTDDEVNPEEPYRYRVGATDKAGNTGPYTDWIDIELYNGPGIDFENGVTAFTNNKVYTLRGTTDPGAAVTVNGTPVDVDADGSFEFSAELSGINATFTVVATKDGVSHTKKQRVTFDNYPPTASITNPANNSTVSGDVTIRASSNDNSTTGSGRSDIDRVLLQIQAGEGNWVDLAELFLYTSGSATYYTAVWDSRAPVNGSVLPDGVYYTFRVLAYDRAGNSVTSAPHYLRLDNTPPATPVGLYVEDTGTDQTKVDQVILAWPNNPDLADLSTSEPYLIYRSESHGTGYELVGTSNTNSYTDKGVTGGKVYYYVIAAKDKAGNISGYSNEAMAIPTLDTTKPVISVSATEGKEYGATPPTLTVNVTDNSHKAPKLIIIAYSQDGGSTWIEFARGLKSSISGSSVRYYLEATWNTEELPEGNYQLKFSAIDNSGNRTDEIRNVSIKRTIEESPILSATPGDGCVVLSWDPVTGSVFKIEIMRSHYLTGGFSKINEITNVSVTSYTDYPSNLEQVYYYKLRITDTIGNTAESNIAWARPGDDMTPPEFVSISPDDGGDSGGPSIMFTAVFRDNKAVTGMNAFYRLDDDDEWTPMVITQRSGQYLSDGRFILTFTWNTAGLESGVYSIKVAAYDAAGNEGSVEVSWNLDFFVSKVQNLRATPYEGYIILDWDDIPADDSYSGYKYQVLYSNSFEGPFSKIGSSGAYTNSTTYIHTNLSPGDIHYYRIESSDKWGNKALSEVLAAKTLPDGIAPSITEVSPAEDATIGGPSEYNMMIYFQDNGNLTRCRLTAEISSDGGSTWSPLPYDIIGPEYNAGKYRFWWIWDLKPLSSGIYMIRYTLYDESDNYFIKEVYYQVDRTSPNPPRELTAQYGAGSITLSWLVPLNYDVSYYRIYRAQALEGPYTELDAVLGKTEYTDSDVLENITYYYKVSAVDRFNQEGECSNIASAAAVRDDVPPTVAGIFPVDNTVLGPVAEITALGKDNVALASLSLEYSVDGGTTWVYVDTVATRDWGTFRWDTKSAGLHGTVLVRVIARDSAGNISDGSVTKTYQVDTRGPTKITGVRVVSVTPTKISLEWDPSTDIDKYYYVIEVQSEPEGGFEIAHVAVNTKGEVENLLPDKEYRIRVAGVDKLGNIGTPSDVIAVKTGPDDIPPSITQTTDPGYYSTSILFGAEGTDNLGVAAFILWYSTDRVNWSEPERINAGGKQEEVVIKDVDLSVYPEGKLYIRVAAEDTAGNVSAQKIVEYVVDRTKPSMPSGFTVTPTGGYMDIRWDPNPENDIKAYMLYRAESPDGPYTLLYALKPDNRSLKDRTTDHGFHYWYKLTALDKAGNESDPALANDVSLYPDTEPPQVHSMAPYSGNKLKGNPLIRVLASDNYRLQAVRLEYLGPDDENWTEIGTARVKKQNAYHDTMDFYWYTSGLADGMYQVRAIAIDAGGRESEPYVVTYEMHIAPPPKPALTATGGPWQVELYWTGSKEDPEFAYYAVDAFHHPGRTVQAVKDNSTGVAYRYRCHTRPALLLPDQSLRPL